jgi:uncharacterized protein
VALPAEIMPEAEPDESGPERRCLVTGAVRAKAGLVRFVLAPVSGDGPAPVVPDIDERLPGRGMWIGAERALVERAIKRNLFARAAGRGALAQADLPDRVASLLAARLQSLIGMARRSRQGVAGAEKVRIALSKGRVGALLIASDAGRDAERSVNGVGDGVVVLRALTGAELGQIFDRDYVAQVAINAGRNADAIAREAMRLGGFLARSERGAAEQCNQAKSELGQR